MTRKIAAVFLLLWAGNLFAAEPKPPGTLLNFSVEATQTVANDLARATVFAEATGLRPAEAASTVNMAMAQAIAAAKTFPDIKTHSGATWTSPVYGRTEQVIEAWRVRSELHLDSQNSAALGELLGKLQDRMGVSQITLQATPETRRKASDQATLEALDAFQAKARVIASHYKKYYRVVRMSVETGGHGPVYPLAQAAMMNREAAPMPIEAGESLVSVTVSGEIELVD